MRELIKVHISQDNNNKDFPEGNWKFTKTQFTPCDFMREIPYTTLVKKFCMCSRMASLNPSGLFIDK